MKTTGIGTDIEEVKRFQKYAKNKKSIFLRKIFTPRELEYCFSRKNPSRHLAARYAGKESVVKALSTLINQTPEYNNIEIINNEDGSPMVYLNKIDNFKVLISLSHTKDLAIAFTLISKQAP